MVETIYPIKVNSFFLLIAAAKEKPKTKQLCIGGYASENGAEGRNLTYHLTVYETVILTLNYSGKKCIS